MIPQTPEDQIIFLKENFCTDESVLISALCIKDKRAFGFLYDKYAPVFYGVILEIVKSEELAGKVLMDVFICIWKTIDQFDEKCKLLTWLLRIANIQAINRICELKHYSA